MKMRTSSSPGRRRRARLRGGDQRFVGENGQVKTLHCVRVDGTSSSRSPAREFELKADLVLLAMGFVHPVHEGMLEDARRRRSTRAAMSQADTSDYQAPACDKVFAAGDMRRGQSLVVWAIREGRQAASAVDGYLMGETVLPR